MKREKVNHLFWGKMNGQFVPNELLEKMRFLDLSEGEMLLILFVMKYQYGSSKPFPSDNVIAEQMGISRRSVIRRKKSLSEKGLIRLRSRFRSDGGRSSCEWDFVPLREKFSMTQEKFNQTNVCTPVTQMSHTPVTLSHTPVTQVSHTPVTQVSHAPVTLVSHQEEDKERRRLRMKKTKMRAQSVAYLSERVGSYLLEPNRPKIKTKKEEKDSEEDSIRKLSEIVDEAKAKTLKARTDKAKKKAVREQFKENLKGDGGGSIPSTRRQIKKLEEMWTDGIRERLPDVTLAAWGGKERGQARQLLEKYNGFLVEVAVYYVLKEWDVIKERYLKGKGVVPTLGFLLRFHDSLFVEAQLWNEFKAVEVEWKRFFEKNPGSLYPPPDLEKKYKAAKKKFECLGF